MRIHDHSAVVVRYNAMGIDRRKTMTGMTDATMAKRSTGGGIVRRNNPSRFATYCMNASHPLATLNVIA